RLSVILIHVPALNDRRSDISILARHFLEEICQDYGMAAKEFSDGAILELQKMDWTGNIRELRNVVERLVILGEKKITEKDIRRFAGTK
ncbi:MAG: sigma-54-dependent Fis family transcriptional regulator, partial [Bacteroidota bacterium]